MCVCVRMRGGQCDVSVTTTRFHAIHKCFIPTYTLIAPLVLSADQKSVSDCGVTIPTPLHPRLVTRLNVD